MEPDRADDLVAAEPDAGQLQGHSRPDESGHAVLPGLARTDASQPIIHSFIAATGGTLLALVVGVFAAYGIARFRAGGRMLPFQILQLRMFPPVAIIIPLLFMLAYLAL